MDEQEWRELAVKLRPDLPRLVADETERARIDAALGEALSLAAGTGTSALQVAIASHAETRKWLRGRIPADVERSITIPGDITAPIGVLFVCPRGQDYDFVRETVSEPVPLCPVHGVALVRAED